MDMKKYHIESNTVQETLVIPLYARAICSRYYPFLFDDPEAERICESLDYDFAEKGKAMESLAGRFGALEVAQRQYDLICEVKDYLKDHPEASIADLGCGLDDTIVRVDNGKCKVFNVDLEDVIQIRNDILTQKDREVNIGCDLRDEAWMDHISNDDGAVFYASGVFYYLKTEEVRDIIDRIAQRFPGSVLVFDSCNSFGAKLMRKTWLKQAGIKDVDAYFSLKDPMELKSWNVNIRKVTSRSYMRGYRDIFHEVGLFHKLMILFCDHLVRMRIVKVEF